jgi:hypothetical protein
MAVFFLYIALPVCDNRGWRMIWVTVNTCFPSNFFFFCSAMTSGSGGCFGEPVLSRNGKKMGSVLKTDSVRFFMGPLSCRRALSVYVMTSSSPAEGGRAAGKEKKKTSSSSAAQPPPTSSSPSSSFSLCICRAVLPPLRPCLLHAGG